MSLNDQLSQPAVRAFVAAVNACDRDALWAALTPDATMTDDGKEHHLAEWAEREIFTSHPRMDVEWESADGLSLRARYHNDIWGDLSSAWTFTLTDGKISHFAAGPG
ncbi:nuclear transport factor 2 family protein [Streptomyces sp. 796.1]|uniref:nuclear transport factor 2 family protein n=1 Tax=Streptomyces sp. 796.1 TaxID=3163029 RepID=UPI0039C9B1F1